MDLFAIAASVIGVGMFTGIALTIVLPAVLLLRSGKTLAVWSALIGGRPGKGQSEVSNA